MDVREKKDTVFAVFSPFLKREVLLYKGVWYGKIVVAHQEVSNRLNLIEDVLKGDGSDIFKYRKRKDLNKICLIKECPHLLPYNRYIKIALDLIDDKQAVITTVHGKNNLPGSDMEEIK